MGCHTEPAAVHIAHVLQRLHFFQFLNFFYNLHDLPQKKLHALTAKNNSIFFIIYTTYPPKKNYTHLPPKKNYTTRRFFRTRLKFFTEKGGVEWGEWVDQGGLCWSTYPVQRLCNPCVLPLCIILPTENL